MGDDAHKFHQAAPLLFEALDAMQRSGNWARARCKGGNYNRYTSVANGGHVDSLEHLGTDNPPKRVGAPFRVLTIVRNKQVCGNA